MHVPLNSCDLDSKLCALTAVNGGTLMRMAGNGWVYAAKLTLEDATGCVDAHLFAGDGAEFFQVRKPVPLVPNERCSHLGGKCAQT